MKNVQKKVGCVDFFTGRGKTGIKQDFVIAKFFELFLVQQGDKLI